MNKEFESNQPSQDRLDCKLLIKNSHLLFLFLPCKFQILQSAGGAPTLNAYNKMYTDV